MSRRIPGSERTREGLRDLIEGRLCSESIRPVKLSITHIFRDRPVNALYCGGGFAGSAADAA
jgi:hypothetical protein